MSPVFRHGKLRLYLLKLLDEAPRHGYEVIRLLQDRFMGVYAPSPGTIYPRLARLEEEGLVTHDTAGGRKVYRITDKGRAEIESRLDDLADLEQEITESVRDIAREVSEDVRDTVRSLREELTVASRELRDARGQGLESAREQARRARDEVRDSARRARRELLGQPGDPDDPAADSAAAGTGMAGIISGKPTRDRAEGPGWPDWTGWAGRAGWASWRGPADPPGRPAWGPPRPGRPDARMIRDLERLAINFASQLRAAAWNTEALGSDKITDLRAILEDTMVRIRDEVFGAGEAGQAGAGPDAAGVPPEEAGREPDGPAGGSPAG